MIDRELNRGCLNYHPLPVVLERGQGPYVYDVDGNKYYDFLAAYSATNQGHCHPKIVEAAVKQISKLTLTSRAFHNDALGEYQEYMTKLFKYDRLLPMNTGVEAVETALKLARRWGYRVKGIKSDGALTIVANGNFHGRTFNAISASSDPSAFTDFGPLVPGYHKINYNDLDMMEKTIISEGPENICAVLIEPIQGEAGVVVPDDGYLAGVRKLCDFYNILFICDEIQTGIGRTGDLSAHDHEEGVRPDIVTLGKALSGGILPVSAVLADTEVMETINPGEHGSTFGGNPLACRIAMTALDVIYEENMIENSREMGEFFRENIRRIDHPSIDLVRGRGLFNAVVIAPEEAPEFAWNVCLEMRKHGLLAKPTHDHIIRFSPALTLTSDQINESCEIIEKSIRNVKNTS